MRNRPVGIFDSGIGGLTVLSQIEKLLPQEDIVYLGDTARVPYGNKSKPTIIKFSRENVLFLMDKKVKMVIVACNTSSALALDYLKRTFNVPIAGVIEPGAEKAVAVSKNGRIGVIGTLSTIESRSYERSILKRKKVVRVYSQACPLFVPLIEEGIIKGKIACAAVKMYLEELKSKRIDTIILGCTHYPLLKQRIAQYLKGVTIVDSAKETALSTQVILKESGLLTYRNKKGGVDFYITDKSNSFLSLAELFLRRKIKRPEVVYV